MSPDRQKKEPQAAVRALRGRIGAYRKWANTSDRTAATEPARRSFLARFDREVDPEGKLPEHERALRAEAARRAYYAQLALKRYQKRQRKSR